MLAARGEHFDGDSIRRYLAELVGTFVLVLCGVGSAVLAGSMIGAAGVAFAFGLALLAMIYAIGPISGCHINPAVTMGLWLSGKMERRHVAGYIGAQAFGALLGAAVVLVIAHGMPGGYSASGAGLGANGYGEHSPSGFGMGAAFLLEAVLTMILVATVLFTTDARAPVGFAGLAIGLALTLVHLVGIPVTNTSVNPARSFGPAVYVGGWALRQLWLFVVAPGVGALTAAGLYRVLRAPGGERLTAAEGERATEAERRQRVRGKAVATPV